MDDPLPIIIGLGAGCLVFGWLGSYIANQKQRGGGEGFALGILFGPLGCLIEALLPNVVPPPQPVVVPAPQPVVLTPAQIARQTQRMRAEQDRIDAERQARHGAFWQFVDEINRRLWWWLSCQWYALLPEWLQPVVIGVAIAIPVLLVGVLGALLKQLIAAQSAP